MISRFSYLHVYPGARGGAVSCGTIIHKVAGSIPDGVIGIFHRHYPSGPTMDVGSTQPLTEISAKNISWGWGS
jgi:hypothetical protein